jgi:hypothetical protein
MISMSADRAIEEWARGIELEMMQRFRQRAMHFGVSGLPEAWDILGWWELMQHLAQSEALIDRTGLRIRAGPQNKLELHSVHYPFQRPQCWAHKLTIAGGTSKINCPSRQRSALQACRCRWKASRQTD